MAKEIIIDGVDVYKCGNAKRSIFGIDMECRLGCDCSQRPNCHYKQLKRAEQKLEKIKDYCLKNKVAGWVDIEGIVEIIEGKDNV